MWLKGFFEAICQVILIILPGFLFLIFRSFTKIKTPQKYCEVCGPTWARTRDHLIMSQVL